MSLRAPRLLPRELAREAGERGWIETSRGRARKTKF